MNTRTRRLSTRMSMSTTNTTGMRTMGKSSPACGTATRIVIQR